MSDEDGPRQERPRPPSSGAARPPSRGGTARSRHARARKPSRGCDQASRHLDAKGDTKRDDSEERALRKIFAQKPVVEANLLDEVARYTRECEKQVGPVTGPSPGGYAIADPSPADQEMAGAGTSDVIDEFLYKLDHEEPVQAQPVHAGDVEMSRPATAQSARSPQAPARVVGTRGAERLAEQVEELRAKMANVLRENRKLKETIELKDQKIRKLLDDIERIRKDPNVMHPSIARLRKVGLNTPALADLGDRWAGYVLGRTSMAMEVGSFSFRNVFAAHATNGVLTEESFKTVLRQFEPSIKSDQLTRLWYFADEDGSGRIDLFEFMRMTGCNSNGEMTDEYYEVLAMHLYRKFHARGGVRRVYATADKNWDQHLNLAEFNRFIKILLKDVELTKREISQVFHRMNVSGSGMLSVHELESALEAAGAKCYVSEAWVKDTFHQLATHVQDAGLSIKSLFPGGIVVEKEFRDIALRFLNQLRPSQLDRLWKYLQTACADDAVQVRHAGGDKDRLPSENVLSVIFGPTLTSSPNELPTGASQGGGAFYGASGGVGREVLEQLVQQLVRRVGDVSPDLCFDTLNPFITAEHFHELLSSRLGLHYDPVKAKQVFKLIDSDRDGKITRLEFRLMFKAVTPDAHTVRRESSDDELERDAEKHQVHRLQNRVLLLQREVEELRGPSGHGHLEPTVPEKQFQQLSTAHGKVANHLQALRAQLQAVHARSPVAAAPTGSPRPSNRRMSDPLGGAGVGSSMTLGESSDEHVKELANAFKEEAESFQTQLQALARSNTLLRRRLRLLHENARKRGISLVSDEEPDSDEAQQAAKKPEVVLCEQLLVSERKAVEDMPVPTAEELYGDVHLVLAKLQKALLRNPAMKKSHVQEMLKKSGEVVIDGRWKVRSLLSYSKRMVVALCYDVHLRQEVIVKMSQTLEASLQLAHADYVLRVLSSVPIVPQVQYCSSPCSSLPFMVMELLQGSTLDARFQEGQEAILELEAAEIGYALLLGMDACHQQQVFNLALCPENVWVGPPLEASRVRILDWSISEIGAAMLANPKLQAYINMRKTGLLRGKSSPKFFSGGHEVSTSDISTRRERKGALLQKLVFSGHGSLYYMSMEQLYQTIRSFERAGTTTASPQSWFQESVGSVVKVEGRTVHWFQKGDGFVQTSQPVAVTPLGHLFEVEVMKAVNLGRKLECELGFCIGLCSKPPRASDKGKPERQDCWIAGGDASFYLKGVQRRVGKTSSDTQQRYLHISSDLRAKDRVAILAEWSGSLSLFVNGEPVGRYSNAIDHCEVVLPLYGVADIFVREASEEYTVRSIGLITDDDMQGGWGVQKEQMERAELELTGIHQLLHGEAAVATTIGPSCDLYACGRILLSLFRGGREPLPSANLDRFVVAYANWAQAGCPPTEKRYGLLWALKELKAEKTERSEELAEVEKGEVKLVVSRCIKRSRYSRLGSCWEAAEMLASASSWLSMSDDFVSSHQVAVRQAKRASLLDTHYALSQELYEQERRLSGAADSSCLKAAELSVQRAAQQREEGSSVSARWNLRSYIIGPAHIQRILQVIQEWPDGQFIQAVTLARFQPNIDEELQESLLSCFAQTLEPQHHRQSPKPKRRRILRHSVADIKLGDLRKPSLFLEDVRLPTEELPRSAFPLEEILSRNILWLIARSVCKLDLTPAPPGVGQEKPPSVGGVPGAMETLVAGMARSTLLVSLSLRSSGLKDQGIFQLATAVAKCQTLRELDLSDNNFGAKGVAKVLQAGKEHLELLDLSRNRLGDAGAKALAEVLLNCHSISTLRLRANGIGDEGGEALAESLMSVTSLREFDFSQNEVHLQTYAVLLRATCSSRGLERLRLDSNQPWPTSDSFEAQIAAFTDQLSGLQAVPSLQLLSLRRCGLSSSACKLFESLATNSTLRQLDVACNGMRQSVAPKIAAALTSPNTGLQELDLRDNRLGAQDAFAVALEQVCAGAAQDANCTVRPTATSGELEAVQERPGRAQNCSLRLLNLANNEMTAEACSRLAAALPYFHGLEELLLYHNALIGDVGAQALAEVLHPDRWPSGRGLKTLSLAACSIGDAGCQALMAAVREYQALTSLDLSCNAITDDSTPAVALVLAQSNSSLEALSLSMNLISSYGISQLMDGVASNPEGALCQIDVSTQDGGQSKTSFVANDALSPRSSSKVKSKFAGLR